MIKPLSNHLLLELVPVEEKTKSGIILANVELQSKFIKEIYPSRAIVKAKGNNTEGIEIGDEVVFMRFGMSDIGGNLGIIDKRDIIAKISPL